MQTFYHHQADARKRTVTLLVLFTIAVLAIWAILTLAVAEFVCCFDYFRSFLYEVANATDKPFVSTQMAIGVGMVTAMTIFAASWYRIQQLRNGGGKVVAAELGGRLVDQESVDRGDQLIINIVQEMAIAAELPEIPVYVLEQEPGINAFVAGYSVDDAIIAVTRGSLQRLDRDQLQAVVAHEFSHIVSGDMRLNIQTLGILHGILFFDLLGQRVIKFADRQWGRDDGCNFTSAFRVSNFVWLLCVAVVGFVLTILGFTGALMGSVIQSAMNRQREFLADATAVEFTRNPQGLAGALKAVAGFTHGSRIKHVGASEFSHLFFNLSCGRLSNWMSSHPPISQRILRLDPDWDGRIEQQTEIEQQEYRGAYKASLNLTGANMLASAPVQASRPRASQSDVASQAVLSGENTAHLYRTQVKAALPSEVQTALDHPAGVTVTLCALLNDGHAESSGYLQQLNTVDPLVHKITSLLTPRIQQLSQPARLIILDDMVSRIDSATNAELQTLQRCVVIMLGTPGDGDYFRWTARNLISRKLAERAGTWKVYIRHVPISQVNLASQVVLSALVYAGTTANAH